MAKHYTETLVVAGPHLQDLYSEIATRLEKIPPGEVQIKRASNRKIIIWSHNPFTAILSYLYDLLRKQYPKNEFVLTSGREGEAARISGHRKGTPLFESYFDFTSDRLPRAAANHQGWLNTMFSS